MCLSKVNIKFCTCSIQEPAIHESKRWKRKNFDLNEYLQTHFVWQLDKYGGLKEEMAMGRVVMPLQKLNEVLTAQNVVQALNENAAFDFEYTPMEGDYLTICEAYIKKKIKNKQRPNLFGRYMTFIFKDQTWINDSYDAFIDELHFFNKGKIKLNNH